MTNGPASCFSGQLRLHRASLASSAILKRFRPRLNRFDTAVQTIVSSENRRLSNAACAAEEAQKKSSKRKKNADELLT